MVLSAKVVGDEFDVQFLDRRDSPTALMQRGGEHLITATQSTLLGTMREQTLLAATGTADNSRTRQRTKPGDRGSGRR
jgi:hypothetical protein